MFNDISAMPDLLKEPRKWFAVCDIDYGGDLSKYEVIEALGACLPVDRHKLEKNVEAHWHEWDPDGDGTITLQEFMMRDLGMRDWVMKNMDILQSIKQGGLRSGKRQPTVPALDQSPNLWFEHWDKDCSGTLERDEMVRALIRTFCLDEQGNPSLDGAFDLRESTQMMWKALGYTPFASITFDEFVKPYGLMDQFVHNQMNCQYFGMDDWLDATSSSNYVSVTD